MKKIVLLCMILWFIVVLPIWAGNVTITWDASAPCENGLEVEGYRMYSGDNQDGSYPNQLCEVNATTLECFVSLNAFEKYWVIGRAFNGTTESINSNEANWPNSCKTISQGGITGGGVIQ